MKNRRAHCMAGSPYENVHVGFFSFIPQGNEKKKKKKKKKKNQLSILMI